MKIKIANKLLVFFLLVSMTPLTIAGLIAYHQTSDAFRAGKLNRLETLAKERVNRIERLFAERKSDVTMLARVPAVEDALENFIRAYSIGGLKTKEYRDAEKRYGPLMAAFTPKEKISDLLMISAGGGEALTVILSVLPEGFALPVLVVQHLHPGDDGSIARHLARATRLPVVEPCDKEPIEPGRVYAAPANYHMLVERNSTIALPIDERVKWSRPSIDVLFESAVRVWEDGIIAVILSGANDDGTKGMRVVREAGGFTIAQDPSRAYTPFMPQAAIDAGIVDEVLGLEEIGQRLVELGSRSAER
ncbi:MAG: chemotaxis protein CheB [Deltaproteobacteria bacterium]|nr:chemotaxis protein CheB [Deltaproteobacteria bacterium]